MCSLFKEMYLRKMSGAPEDVGRCRSERCQWEGPDIWKEGHVLEFGNGLAVPDCFFKQKSTMNG